MMMMIGPNPANQSPFLPMGSFSSSFSGERKNENVNLGPIVFDYYPINAIAWPIQCRQKPLNFYILMNRGAIFLMYLLLHRKTLASSGRLCLFVSKKSSSFHFSLLLLKLHFTEKKLEPILKNWALRLLLLLSLLHCIAWPFNSVKRLHKHRRPDTHEALTHPGLPDRLIDWRRVEANGKERCRKVADLESWKK